MRLKYAKNLPKIESIFMGKARAKLRFLPPCPSAAGILTTEVAENAEILFFPKTLCALSYAL